MSRTALANNPAGRTVAGPAGRCHLRTGAGRRAGTGSRRGADMGAPAWGDLGTAAGTVAAARFYCSLFGWTVVARHRPLDDRTGYWTFRHDGTDVGGLAPARDAAWTVYIAVRDTDAVARAVVDNGGAVLAGPMTVDAGRVLVCADPCGATFVVCRPDRDGEAPTGDRSGDRTDEAGPMASFLLACRDVDAAKAFYGAVFGWEAVTTHLAGGATYTEFFRPGSGRCVAHMVEIDGRWPEAVPAGWMPHLPVADADRTAARAAELGGTVAVSTVEVPAIGRLAVIGDPEGAAVAVSQPAC
jgi:predicted enzyme related to lactoylglutathione lyase